MKKIGFILLLAMLGVLGCQTAQAPQGAQHYQPWQEPEQLKKDFPPISTEEMGSCTRCGIVEQQKQLGKHFEIEPTPIVPVVEQQ